MTTKPEEIHKHSFKKLGYVREVGTTNPAQELRVSVAARMIDRIILTRSCTGKVGGKSCTASQAFECGDKEKMRALYRELKVRGGE